MDKSPYLSDESLKEIAKKEDGLTAPMVRDVLVANPQAAKSAEIKQLLDERIDELPTYMIEQIEAGITGISPKEYLEMQKSSLQREYSENSSKMMRHYMRNPESYNDTDIEELLSVQEGTSASVRLAGYYASKGNYLQAKSVIDNMNCIDQQQQNEMDNLSELYTLLDTVKPDNLSSESINILLNIESDGGTAGSYARGLLVFNNIIEYNEPVFMPEPLINNKNIKHDLENKDEYFKIYPNPASEYIYIDYKLEESTGIITLDVLDVNGKVVKSNKLMYNVDNKLMSMGKLNEGTYIFVLKINGKIKYSTNAVIVK